MTTKATIGTSGEGGFILRVLLLVREGYVGQGGRDSNSCTITDLSWCVSSNTIGRDVGLPARGGGARYYHVTYHETAFRL